MPPPAKCEACRASERPCDLQRPKCRQCDARTIDCVYPSGPVTFTFVDQNDAAAVASRRAASRSSHERRITFPLDTSLLARGRRSETGRGPQMVPPILNTLDTRVLERFFARWAARQTSLGCLDFMPQFFEASAQESAMRSAILATAYADLAILERRGDRGTESYRAYIKAIRSLQHELASPNFTANDGILAAILTVDAFELLYMGRIEPLGIHTQAIVRLLELRKEYATENQQSFSLWRTAYQRIYARQLLYNIPLLDSARFRDFAPEGQNHRSTRTIKFVADACDALSQLALEREKPIEQADLRQIMRLCIFLRNIVDEARQWSEADPTGLRRVPFDVASDPDLRLVFPSQTVIVYDDASTARDRFLTHICSIRILEALIEQHVQNFSSQYSRGENDLDGVRNFLLVAQPDMAALQELCRAVLDSVPFFIRLVASDGSIQATPWTLNDTGVLTVKSPLRTIGQIQYLAPEIRDEAKGILGLFEAHRHVVYQS